MPGRQEPCPAPAQGDDRTTRTDAAADEGPLPEVSEGTHRTLDLLLKRRDGLEHARQELLATVTKLRTGTVTTAVVILLAGFLLQRFIYITGDGRLFLGLAPLALIGGAALIDLVRYRSQLTGLEDRIDRLDADIEARGGDLLGGPEDRRRELDTWAIAGFYLLPGLVTLGVTIWWMM